MRQRLRPRCPAAAARVLVLFCLAIIVVTLRGWGSVPEVEARQGDASRAGARSVPIASPSPTSSSGEAVAESERAASWAVDFFGVLLGAFLGAFFGYRFSRRLRRRETEARREVLFRALQAELERIVPEVPTYATGAIFLPPTLRLSALPLLLDGETVDFEDESLVQMLLNLQVAVAKHNDLVATTNPSLVMAELAETTAVDSEPARRKIFQVMSASYQGVVSERDRVLKVLLARPAAGELPRLIGARRS